MVSVLPLQQQVQRRLPRNPHAFVALGLVKPVLLLFAVVDLAAAVWSGVSLRRDGATEPGRA